MSLKKTLLELKKLMEKWGIEPGSWSLVLHYCAPLLGYNTEYGRDKHLHIVVNEEKLPWKIKKKEVNYEVTIPFNSRYEKDFIDFINKTGHDFHLIVGEPKLFKRIWRQHGIFYKIRQDKVPILSIIGNLIWWGITAEKWRKKKNNSPEVWARRFLWAESLLQEADKKGDLIVVHEIKKLFKKYRPKDNPKTRLNKENSLLYYKKNKAVKGNIGSPGKAKGKVYFIDDPDKIPKIRKNTVLVAKLTSPKLLNQIKNSIAVVTDEGGALSHAAIICRELKMPCVIGAVIATKVFKDGDLVEVDAGKGIVKKVK